MSNVKILDCTLRDGGYINDWKFAKGTMRRICKLLTLSNIDYIEIGYLTTNIQETDSSMFNDIDTINEVFDGYSNLVCMINYGDFPIELICDSSETVIDGIRVAFHKEKLREGLEFCRQLQDKGYEIYVQPMITSRYSNNEIVELVELVNDLTPKALYIVDSFGTFRDEDIQDLTGLVASFLSESITLGFHSHNNLQLSFSNSKQFINSCHGRSIIIDSSVFGIGRGAGNLCSEMIVEYLNNLYEASYESKYLLQIYDEIVAKMYTIKKWGYSIPYMISAKYNLHPSYSTFLFSKNTLKLETIEEIMDRIPNNKRYRFFKDIVEKLYFEHQNNQVEDKKNISFLKSLINNQKVVIKASPIETNLNGFVISVNFEDEDSNLSFVTNERLLYKISDFSKLIVSSNISAENYKQINYKSLVDNNYRMEEPILMTIRLLIMLGVKEVDVLGYEKYSLEYITSNAEEILAKELTVEQLEDINEKINSVICEYKNRIKINFI